MAADFFHSLEKEIIKKRDFSLIKSTLSGNHKSFSMLMALYKLRIVSFGRSFFKDERDIEDFVQDVFIKVYLNLATFKGESMFSTWLIRIAYTTAINSVKRRKEYYQLEDETLLPDTKSCSPEEIEIRKITQDAIRTAISELPEKYAVCIEMYFFYDIPYKEISEITEFPENTIKSHIFRAKKILKARLEEYYEQ